MSSETTIPDGDKGAGDGGDEIAFFVGIKPGYVLPWPSGLSAALRWGTSTFSSGEDGADSSVFLLPGGLHGTLGCEPQAEDAEGATLGVDCPFPPTSSSDLTRSLRYSGSNETEGEDG